MMGAETRRECCERTAQSLRLPSVNPKGLKTFTLSFSVSVYAAGGFKAGRKDERRCAWREAFSGVHPAMRFRGPRIRRWKLTAEGGCWVSSLHPDGSLRVAGLLQQPSPITLDRTSNEGRLTPCRPGGVVRRRMRNGNLPVKKDRRKSKAPFDPQDVQRY